MYRPKDWKEKWVGPKVFTSREIRDIYEAGADAMLESLRLNGYVSGESLANMGGVGWKNISPKSKWHFIPDES